MPIKEVGYCNYNNNDWCKKYDDLIYADKYKTKIIGNTFYLQVDITDRASDYGWIEKLILKKSNKNLQSLCIIPMITASEETIRDVLRAWNFSVKYKWLNDDLK